MFVFTPQKGRYLDGGSVFGLLKANIVVAKDNPELKEDLKELIEQEFSIK